MAMREGGWAAGPKKFEGTFEEALGFLTNPTSGMVAWTDLEALTEVCHRVAGFPSYAAASAEWGESDMRGTLLMIEQTLQALDHSRPVQADDGGWRGWLDAYLGGDPQIEILLFEEAAIVHRTRIHTDEDVDPSIITSAVG